MVRESLRLVPEVRVAELEGVIIAAEMDLLPPLLPLLPLLMFIVDFGLAAEEEPTGDDLLMSE